MEVRAVTATGALAQQAACLRQRVALFRVQVGVAAAPWAALPAPGAAPARVAWRTS